MTTFIKENFVYSGGFLVYYHGDERKFVARFKHRSSPFTKAKFLKELIKNHSVESYFHSMENEKKAPLEILREVNPAWFQKCIKNDTV